MQRTRVLPHPTDISKEISHLVADPNDLFPAKAGRGTIEAMIGGKNVEERYGVSLAGVAAVLRHKSADMTMHYAKVDFALLSEIAQPWAGRLPC